MRAAAWFLKDPRYFQIAFLSSFFLFGFAELRFEIPWWQPLILLTTTCATQWLMTQILRLPSAGYLSPIITGLGLTLLLRTDVPVVLPMAAFIAIAAKFLIRVRGKHIFNPATIGLGASMLLTSRAWCSPSQWGESTVLLAWLGVLGGLVVYRALRTDISFAFLGTWVVLKAGRIFYLGYPNALEVLSHQLAVGSLILFTFFMISDPKSTPDHRVGRILFAVLVAGVAFYAQHWMWKQNSVIWALLILSPLTPLIDRIFTSGRYAWPTSQRSALCPATVST